MDDFALDAVEDSEDQGPGAEGTDGEDYASTSEQEGTDLDDEEEEELEYRPMPLKKLYDKLQVRWFVFVVVVVVFFSR